MTDKPRQTLWILLALTSLCCSVGGFFVFQKLNGNIIEAGSARVFTTLAMVLAIIGLMSLLVGARGFFRARGDKQFTPLAVSLNGIMGALALMMALFFILP
jgi:hypothetical protein